MMVLAVQLGRKVILVEPQVHLVRQVLLAIMVPQALKVPPAQQVHQA
jgi:hypothetical protein